MPIVNRPASVEEVRTRLRESPPAALREMLPDSETLAACRIDVRPGRLEPRALTREWKHYPRLRLSRSEWRRQRLRGAG